QDAKKALQASVTTLEAANRDLGKANTDLEDEISKRKRVAVELCETKKVAEAANCAKSHFLANISHEIRTPMTAIIGMTELTLDTELTPEQRDSLETVKRSADALLELINDILDLSKIEAGRITLTENAFDLYDLLNTIYEMFKLKATSKGLQLGIECDSKLPQYVHTDEGKLRQILLNLLSNAIKFTDAGKVNLYVAEEQRSDRHYLTFAVQDTGAGIAQHELANLFEKLSKNQSLRKELGVNAKNRIIEKDLAEKMSRMVGFRNIAVHDYQQINVEILKSILTRHLKDFEDYYSTIYKYVKADKRET
ncbi:MAG: DUF86 domain-containing protein, partial [Chloroflexi bacterium]|nr:DUF86 domain-containing protein [Chloroflexota bacterium]